MSDKEAPPKKAKGKGMMMIVIGAVVLLAVGGGGVFGLVQAGVIGGGHAEKEDDKPKLIRKGEEDPYAVKGEGEEEGGEEVYGEGGSEYRTAYYTFGDEFTSNLKDSDALIQIGLAASTRRDGRVLMWLKQHELAIRSALLTVLADTPENDVYTVEGKDRLQKRLTAAINHVLTEHEGFGGIDAVYFRTFIIQ
ncbi:flagellar basal body-associated protein FliL [Novosphingobium sp. PC22D]|uniref:flagellar basal body-associated FliL family protein n=1 Tax=Novosphingobium sp. PC22D TaxID=1962403 RepID=UPI000BF2353F|nr:flagellar basal body-associated FliL family protein [Novosphingobium sp. PC22D]PEQ14299.1 flagellar basal body-associated protein FliL [Novosphingobium sp. PC22D]